MRVKFLLGLDHLYERRDKHFGNGRLSRNLFENSIRLMANRIVKIPEITVEQLPMLESTDLEFEKIPNEVFEDLKNESKLRFHIECPHCNFAKDVSQKFLGQSVRCPKCNLDFTIYWGFPRIEKDEL